MDTVWHYLADYESKDLVKKYYKRRFDYELNSRNAGEIAANFIQAREYFVNAERAARSVRPLFQYYGVISLSRGLTLISTNTREQGKSGHGLDAQGWISHLGQKEERVVSLDKLETRIVNGTYLDLLKATENTSFIRINPKDEHFFTISYTLPPENSQMTFDDVARCMPDCSREYKNWKSTSNGLISVSLNTYLAQPPCLIFPLEVTEESIRQVLLSDSIKDLPKQALPKSAQVLILEDGVKPFITQRFVSDGPLEIGFTFLTKRIGSDKFALNSLGLYFAIAYYLGMLVRYYPYIWTRLGTPTAGDSVTPLLNRMMDLIQTKFPELIFDFLNITRDGLPNPAMRVAAPAA